LSCFGAGSSRKQEYELDKIKCPSFLDLTSWIVSRYVFLSHKNTRRAENQIEEELSKFAKIRMSV
jgi:hypothetical protein